MGLPWVPLVTVGCRELALWITLQSSLNCLTASVRVWRFRTGLFNRVTPGVCSDAMGQASK